MSPRSWSLIIVVVAVLIVGSLDFLHLTDGQRWLRPWCGHLETEIDPRSIAETIECLPLPSRCVSADEGEAP